MTAPTTASVKRNTLFSHHGDDLINDDLAGEVGQNNSMGDDDVDVEDGERNDDEGSDDGSRVNLFEPNLRAGSSTGRYSDDVDDSHTEVLPVTGNIDTITIKTLSLRMSDLMPNDSSCHFEVWVYTGPPGDDNGFIDANENDMDDDPTNDNPVVPSKGDYKSARAKFADWQLVAEGLERDLIPDTDFYDSSGHVFNIGTNATTGPLGNLAEYYNNIDEVTLAAKQYNAKMSRDDGGMDAFTVEGGFATTYFYKIPEEKFTPLKIPKYNGKLTLFATLNRAAMQYGTATEDESNEIDASTQDEVPNWNGNDFDLNLHVGEGVMVYPWMFEDAFYQRRRFLGKVWYDEQTTCDDNEYIPPVETEGIDVSDETAVPSKPNARSFDDEDLSINTTPMISSRNERVIMSDLLISVALINDRPLPPMPNDVKATLERMLLNFVDLGIGDFCSLTWNEAAIVTKQDARSIVIESSVAGNAIPSMTESRKREGHGIHYLRRLVESTFLPLPTSSRNQLLRSISVIDITASFEAMFDSVSCPNFSKDEFAIHIEVFINDNRGDLLKRLKAASGLFFSNAFGVSADALR